VSDIEAAEDAMFAPDLAVFTDGETVELERWNDGDWPAAWQHAVPFTDQPVIKVDASTDRTS
jgi:hypothetical protein